MSEPQVWTCRTWESGRKAAWKDHSKRIVRVVIEAMVAGFFGYIASNSNPGWAVALALGVPAVVEGLYLNWVLLSTLKAQRDEARTLVDEFDRWNQSPEGRRRAFLDALHEAAHEGMETAKTETIPCLKTLAWAEEVKVFVKGSLTDPGTNKVAQILNHQVEEAKNGRIGAHNVVYTFQRDLEKLEQVLTVRDIAPTFEPCHPKDWHVFKKPHIRNS